MPNAVNKLVGALAVIAAVAMIYALAQQLIKTTMLQTLDAEDISVGEALQVAQGALDACKGGGPAISVAVVDENGDVRFLLRGNNATPDMADKARRKAYTARTFRMATSDWVERTSDTAVDEKGALRDLGGQRLLDNTIAEAGGMPIIKHGEAIGGVGVSGSKDGETDEHCAQAGVDAISDQFF
jgi:uncharacterized protein GlcG (DUF336 family)